MKAYKIKVANEAESEEAQELFFELGYEWEINKKEVSYTNYYLFYAQDDGILNMGGDPYYFYASKNQEINLPQLHDLTILHRNDVGDATHISEDGEMYHIANDVFVWQDGKWAQSSVLTPDLKTIKEAKPQMTWQDALRAVADGKEVEAYSDLTLGWFSISSTTIGSIKDSQSKFRLAPQRKTLNGNFTKEELLKIAGEMG